MGSLWLLLDDIVKETNTRIFEGYVISHTLELLEHDRFGNVQSVSHANPFNDYIWERMEFAVHDTPAALESVFRHQGCYWMVLE